MKHIKQAVWIKARPDSPEGAIQPKILKMYVAKDVILYLPGPKV